MGYLKRWHASLLVAIIVWALWLGLAGPENALSYIKENWPITITMIFGSLVAGATSEGGGAIAFPVFTKVLHITPWDAKLFSLAIQSVGMSAASIVIILTGIKVEWRVIRWASIGGAMGMLLGATGLAPALPPDITKMTFTVMVGCFAIALYLLNRRERRCHERLPTDGGVERSLLIAIGLAGGLLSSMVGTGLDIITFSMLVLLFRVSEKITTPTSVILMAINSIVGVITYFVVLGKMNEAVFGYWMAAVPIVVVGAPLGAILCSYMSRATIANVLIGLISFEVISSLLIIPLRSTVVWYSMAAFIICLSLYALMLRTQRYEAPPLVLPEYQ